MRTCRVARAHASASVLLRGREGDDAVASPRRAQARQHRGARPEHLERAVLQQRQLVERRHERRVVGHHDHGDAARLEFGERGEQRRFAGGVEIGVRLIEHDEPRLAVQRARERDALALAAREHRAAVADLRVVAVRQLQDHFVCVREPRRANDALRGFRRRTIAPRRAMFSPTVPANSSTSCGR